MCYIRIILKLLLVTIVVVAVTLRVIAVFSLMNINVIKHHCNSPPPILDIIMCNIFCIYMNDKCNF